MLGIDREIPHDSTQSTKASHFQFLKISALDLNNGDAVLKATAHHYGKESVDFLIDVVGQGGERLEQKMGAVVDKMNNSGQGLVLYVTNENGEKEIVSGDIKMLPSSCILASSAPGWCFHCEYSPERKIAKTADGFYTDLLA